MTTKKTNPSRFTLHQLISALTFLGGSVRLLLIAFLVATVFILRVVYLDTPIDVEVKMVIYVLGSLAVLDISYVMLARSFPFRQRLDAICLLFVEALITLAYVLPNFVNTSSLNWFSTWTILIVLFVVAIRALLGLLFAVRKR